MPTETDLDAWLGASGFTAIDAFNAGFTPLMLAARQGRADRVGALLARGADPNVRNSDGNGALWFACFADCEACIAALIEAGVDLDNQNVNGATALIYACSAGKAGVVRQLLAASADIQRRTLDDFKAIDSCSSRECLELMRAAGRTNRHAAAL